MKLIDLARDEKDVFNDGFHYVAVWTEKTKNGKRTWAYMEFSPEDYRGENDPIFSAEQQNEFRRILVRDHRAIMLNGYFNADIGSQKYPYNAVHIAKAVKRHYTYNSYSLRNHIEFDDTDVENEVDDCTNTEAITFKKLISGGNDYYNFYGLRVAAYRPQYSVAVFRGYGYGSELLKQGKITENGVFEVDGEPFTEFDNQEVLRFSAAERNIIINLL